MRNRVGVWVVLRLALPLREIGLILFYFFNDVFLIENKKNEAAKNKMNSNLKKKRELQK